MTDPRDSQGGAGNAGPGDSTESPSANGVSGEGAERPRRSKKAKQDSPEVPSGWRSSRRGSKTAQRARKEMKSREAKERMAEGARDTGRKITDGATALGKGIAGVALGLLIVVLLFTGINGIARWNAKRLDDLENSPEALLEQARDNLLFIADEEGRAVGFLALKVEGDREQIYGIAIPDAAFVEVPGRGFQRIGESYEAGPDVSLSAVSNFFTVPVHHVRDHPAGGLSGGADRAVA